MSTPYTELPGLQAERTALAWDRTSLGLLATGTLLITRDATVLHAGPLLAGGAALLLALVSALVGRRRARRLRSGTAPVAYGEVALLGCGVVALGLRVAVVTVVG